MAASKVIRPAISVLLLGFTALGAMNVYSDNTELKARVETMACGKVGCAARLIREERSAFSQKFEYQTSVSPIVTKSYVCTKSAIVFGEHSCVPE